MSILQLTLMTHHAGFLFPVTGVKNLGTACTIRRFKEKEQNR